jgi:hypothetical protein
MWVGLESALISMYFVFFFEKTGMVLRNWKQQGWKWKNW